MLKFHKKNTQNAQGMVEFALVLPILLLLIFGVIAFGHLFFVYSFTVAASREAARWGAAVGNTSSGLPRFRDCNEILQTAARVGGVAGVRPENIVIQYDHGPNTGAPYATCPAGGSGPDVALSDRIIVTTVVNYKPIVPLVNISAFPIEAVTARTIIRGLPVGSAPTIPPSCISTFFEFEVMTGELDVDSTESINYAVKAVGAQQPTSGQVNIWIGGNQKVTNSNKLSDSITFIPNAGGAFEVKGTFKSTDSKFCSIDPASVFPIKVRKQSLVKFVPGMADLPDPSKPDEGVIIKLYVESKIGTTVPIPTGIVNVNDSLDTGIGCQILLEADGTGTCLLMGYPAAGVRTLQAEYLGDDDYGKSPFAFEQHIVEGVVPPTLVPTPTIAASPTPKPLCPVLMTTFNFTEQKDGFWVSIKNPDVTQAKLYNLTVTWPSVPSGDSLLKEVRFDTTTSAVCNPASPTAACIWVPSEFPLPPTQQILGLEGDFGWSGPADLVLQPGQTKQLRFVYTSPLPNTKKNNPVKYAMTIQFDKMVNNQRCKIVIPDTERNVK